MNTATPIPFEGARLGLFLILLPWLIAAAVYLILN